MIYTIVTAGDFVSEKIKVLIVDDSALMRKSLKEIIMTDTSMEVVGTARDGQDAIEKVRDLEPDVITMDINMPVMDGLTSMQYILSEFPEIPVIIISSLTEDGALTTFEALELGAFDYVAKPSGTVSSNLHIVGREIIQKIKLAYKGMNKKSIRDRVKRQQSIILPKKSLPLKKDLRVKDKSKVVAIGISTGGPSTLMEVLPMLPQDLKAAVVIVQHMPPSFTSSFAKRLNDACRIPIKEAEAGDVLQNGRGYLAPGGYQLVARGNGGILRLTNTPITVFMPSVNVMMESMLDAFGGENVVGVLMTGMGDDGVEAMIKIRNAGGVTIAEDESTAAVFGMPREAIERGGAEIVVPSYKIADAIIKAVNK
ncbi:chemotaxis response regulator protein-glutamate methylesterase [Ruminiclostridium herbifermentans]|uniref:Protein-glutamate methylesterase/protein-glutamine glutaminase n=1 Tax=Ruminiclostridium herbifermentans TaxID=2488810 RepID=A0A7H1VL71_9FIRM|nr:chemotaxis response regulator protein-glutamate methylesterase [Ruminiclostridium herbifermentans]QNU66133.1 chemotaxis response regulator protein-glutamate methylesterase [Ruminiclostridium herbifermentans]